ncbi:MAG: sporulation protein [Synechococcaceae cyanobacterium SM2_3_1]|nr:sporulation protein [Synechococcaceae cyanobacterium SM2_3_1]
MTLPIYQVWVESGTPESLDQVRTVVPDAYLAVGSDGPHILGGTFINRTHAQDRKTRLEQLGLQVVVVETTATQESAPASTDPPPASSPVSTPIPASPPGSENLVNLNRPYVVLVINPDNDPQWVTQVRRFFPNAVTTTYQQQPALQTGSFSQLSQAQAQSGWLSSQGWQALAIPNPSFRTSTTPASAPPPASADDGNSTSSAGEAFWLLVADPTGDQLNAIRQLIPDAIPLVYDNLRVVRVGGFANPEAAQPQIQRLASQGFEAGLFPADLSRTKPVLTVQPASTAPTPEPTPTPTDNASNSPPAAPDSVYIVITAATQGESQLTQIQSFAPDAFLKEWQERSVIQVGTYRQRRNAEEALQSLSQLGLTGEIVASD